MGDGVRQRNIVSRREGRDAKYFNLYKIYVISSLNKIILQGVTMILL